jgi:hypothetical protein
VPSLRGRSILWQRLGTLRVQRGETIMQHIAFACAALAFAIFASPAVAQQTPPEQQPPPTSQPVPEAPPPQQAVPPPLPPMPSSRPSHRWVDVGGHHTASSRHHAATSHRQATKKHNAKDKHHAKHVTEKHHATHKHSAPHLSKRTIRQCHSMTYKQIMKHSNCRDLMSHEIETAEQKHRHASHHKGKAHHNSKAHNHSKAHHHRS